MENEGSDVELLELRDVDAAPEVNLPENVPEQKEEISETKQKTNHIAGNVQKITTNEEEFEAQFHCFLNKKKAIDPTTGEDVIAPKKENDQDAKKSKKQIKRELREKRKLMNDPSKGDYLGPWSAYAGMQAEIDEKCELTEEQKEMLERYEDLRQKKIEELKSEESKTVVVQAQSEFHSNLSKDYEGRSFMAPPNESKTEITKCFLPNKVVHTYVGHSKGVQCIRPFPKFGHLLLSGSLDSTIKLWDVSTNKNCILTYKGHSEGVRDLCFSNNGKTFLSASYDKNVVLWDTEYGKTIQAFTNRKIPYSVKFHPDRRNPNTFLVASQCKKILQYDILTGEVVTQYEEHTGAVNSVTFLDYGRKFVSTGDDKKIFLWEFGVAAGMKQIHEPDMQVVPTAAAHPNLKYLAGQSMDNKI